VSDRQTPGAEAGRRIFREAALERLHSPEQLDQRIGLIPPAMRLLAASATVIILAALAWAVFGTVPTRATGRGVLLADRAGNFAVSAQSPGLVLEIFVKPGDRVEAGAEIARIEQRLLAAQIENGMAQVARLEANLAKVKDAHAEQIRRSDETARRQQAAVDGQIAANEVRRERLRQLVAGYESLRARGMISQTEIINQQWQYDETVLELANASSKKIEIEATAQMKRDDLAYIERQKEADIDLKKAEVEELKVEKALGSIVKAPVSGVIQEVRVGRGGVTSVGAVLVTIGSGVADNVEMLVLLSSERRKRVAVGMEAFVMPDGTKREEFGSMRGRVVDVSESEMSHEHIEQILQNAQLTKRLVGDDASALVARVELVPSKTNSSGYEWWSGSGPPYRITPGSVANLDIIVDEVRPISLIIPALRKLLSING